MNYKPLSKQQAIEMSRPPLIEDGVYQAILLEYMNVNREGHVLKDKDGDPMTRVKFKIWDKNGHERYISTNLFWGENNKMAYRTRHFAESFKVIEMYESGKLYEEMTKVVGLSGMCEIYKQKASVDKNGREWPEKNEIRDFSENVTRKPEKINSTSDFFNDSIPF